MLLLLLFFVPSVAWEINGRTMSSAELWSSGRLVSIASTMTFSIFGIWGIVARKHASRWLLVLAPFSPYIFLFALPSDMVNLSEIVTAALTAIILYIFFFRFRANREYFNDRKVGT